MKTTCFVVILVGWLFLKKSNASAVQTHFHTVEISSLVHSASTCNPSTTGFDKRGATLTVTEQQGPCSPLGQANSRQSSLREILVHDQSRVESLQEQIRSNSVGSEIKGMSLESNSRLNEKKASLPAQSGRALGSGNYIVNVGLGTPRKTLSLMFDTGSDLTWTQCEPCARSCYKQQDPIFNPKASSSYLNVSCDSNQCSQLSVTTGVNPGCVTSTRTCIYGIKYGDQSFSVGYFSKDTLTLSETEAFPNFVFGCGQNNQGLFGKTAGIIGLGRDPLSIVSQTATKYGKYFSYCLPSTSHSTGYLALGKRGSSSNTQFTPFVQSSRGQTLYFIEILSIIVGGHQLPIDKSIFSTGGSIIDSGTVITRLPPTVYSALSAEFRKQMTNYQTAPAFSILDTCYDIGNLTTITIPVVSFIFSGNVRVNIAPSGILIAVSSSTLCLAFAGNKADSSVAIFGNTQQKTFEIIYDVTGELLGFRPGGCN